MAGQSHRATAAGNAARPRRPAASPIADAAAPRKRKAPPPPRRATLDARLIDWWRSLQPGTRLSYYGLALTASALLIFVALLARLDYQSPLSLAGALCYALLGWAAYPLPVLLVLLGAIWLGKGMFRRAIVSTRLIVLVFAFWGVVLAGSVPLFGDDTGGLVGLLLSWPLRALLPTVLGIFVAALLAVVILLAIAQVTPEHLAVAGSAGIRYAGLGLRTARDRIPSRRPRSQATTAEMPRTAYQEGLAEAQGSAVRGMRPASGEVGNGQGFAPLSRPLAARPDDIYADDDEDDEPSAPLGFANMHEPPREWALPPLDLLDAPQVVTDDGDERVDELAERLEQVLRSFRVDAEVRRADISVGPTVIRFGIRPIDRLRRDEHGRPVHDEDGRPVMVRTRVSRIMNLRSDLALALEAHSLRMEAPVPGQPYVGVEIPRPRSHMVTLREVLTSDEFQKHAKKSKLAVTLGRDVSGQARAADLTKFPHVLVAGATGAGKSVCLNGFLCSILSQATPDDVRVLLVDPKKVELTVYNGVPHLLAPVVTEAKAVPDLLKRALGEMERRYQLFSELGVRNLEGYRHLARQEPELERLPNIVIVIDELADLMMAAPEEVEYMICRLAQLARATGLHLVVATQRPSVDVITGLIKANIPTRVAFMVSSQVDSRTILDMGGAEALLGRGDSLFLSADASKPERIQGAFVSDEEVGRLVRFWRGQARALLPASPAYPAHPARSGRSVRTSIVPMSALDDEADALDLDDEAPPIPPLPQLPPLTGDSRQQMAPRWPIASPGTPSADDEREVRRGIQGAWERGMQVPFEYRQAEADGWTGDQEGNKIPPRGPWQPPSPHHA